MDLICKRYSSPFLVLDNIIAAGRFKDFINELNNAVLHEEIYELWLHKVFDKTFEEFKNDVIEEMKAQQITPEAKEATIKNSFEILNNFKPE